MKTGVTILIEKESQGKHVVFIASSPEINVLAEGKTIEEAKDNFLVGLKFHLKNFPEENAN